MSETSEWAARNQEEWVAAQRSRFARAPFVSRSTAEQLLAEAGRFRFAALLSYVAHREMRMDTEADEALRLKVLTRLRVLLGVTAGDGWQTTGLSKYAEAVAARDTAEAEVARLRALLDRHSIDPAALADAVPPATGV